ncbi:hypothetical protein KZO01_07610 [Kurthia zopfii]|nr:hypothetical protein KZO01_07610 [Kurthia zopfii]
MRDLFRFIWQIGYIEPYVSKNKKPLYGIIRLLAITNFHTITLFNTNLLR